MVIIRRTPPEPLFRQTLETNFSYEKHLPNPSLTLIDGSHSTNVWKKITGLKKHNRNGLSILAQSKAPQALVDSPQTKFLKKFLKSNLPPKAQEGYEKILNFSLAKKVPFEDLNILLDNLAKKTGFSLNDLSPYVVLMQWGTYAILWDLKQNVRFLQKEGDKLPEFLKDKTKGYPDIVLEKLLEGEITPNPGLSELSTALAQYDRAKNQYWGLQGDEEYVLDLTHYEDVESILHEMYHAFQDASWINDITELEAERDAHFIGNLAAIMTLGITSEAALLEKMPEKYKSPPKVSWSVGKKEDEIKLPFPEGNSYAFAAYHFLFTPEKYHTFQERADILIKKWNGFYREWEARGKKIGQLLVEATQLFSNEAAPGIWKDSPLNQVRSQLNHAEDQIKALARLHGGFDLNKPGDLEKWHQYLYEQLKNIESEAKTMGSYRWISYQNRKKNEVFNSYLWLLALKFLAMDFLVQMDQLEPGSFKKPLKEIFSSSIAFYSDKFFTDAKSNGIGFEKPKPREATGVKTNLTLLKLTEIGKGLTDSEWEAIHSLTQFIEKEKIPLERLITIAKNQPDKLRNEPTNPASRWQYRLILQWQMYSLAFAILKRWDIFSKNIMNKMPKDAKERLEAFKKNVLELIEKWKTWAINVPQNGIDYDSEKNLIQIPVSKPFISMDNKVGTVDLIRSLYLAYTKNRYGKNRIFLSWDMEAFILWIIANYKLSTYFPPNKKPSQTEMENDILRNLRQTLPEETGHLSSLYRSLASNGSNFVIGLQDQKVPSTPSQKWTEIEKDYLFLNLWLWKEMEMHHYLNLLSEHVGLEREDITLRWSKVLRNEWDKKKLKPIEKYALLAMIKNRVDFWNLLGLPHDFQGVTLENPEKFYKKNLDPRAK